MLDGPDLAVVDQRLAEGEDGSSGPAEADEQAAPCSIGKVAHARCRSAIEGEGLFDQHMRTGVERCDHLFFVSNRWAGHDHNVGLQSQGVPPVGKGVRDLERGGERLRRRFVRAAQRHDLDVGMPGQRGQMAGL